MPLLAVGRGLETDLHRLRDLFTAAELAAADLLLQLRLGEAGATASTSTSSSWRSASLCCQDLDAVEEEERVVVGGTASSLEERDVRMRNNSANSCLEGLSVVDEVELEPPRIANKETASSSPGSMELDRRARKRYRLLPELYAATAPVTSPAAAKKRKRKGHHNDTAGVGESSEQQRTRYGDL